MPHAGRRGHEGRDRAEPRRRLPAVARGRARRGDDPGRSSAARSPIRSRSRTTGSPGCRPTSSPARTPTRSRPTSPRSRRCPFAAAAGTAGGGGRQRRRRGRAGRQGDLRRGRLRRLPHAEGRGHERQRRPEPRRREAVEGARDRARHERHGRDAVVQGLSTRRSRSKRSPTSSRRTPASSRRSGLERVASASRSTTTCVIGTSKRSRARADDVALEPVRAALGMRRDDDLVGAEGAQRVLDRLQRVAVADLALAPRCRRARAARGSRRAAAARRRARRPRPTPSPHRRVERRADDEHLLVHALGLARAGSSSSSSPPTVSFATTRIRRSSSALARVGTAVRSGGSSERERDPDHDGDRGQQRRRPPARARSRSPPRRRSARSSRPSAGGSGMPRPRCGTGSAPSAAQSR